MDTILCSGGVHDTVSFCGYAGSGQYIAFRNVHLTSATIQYANIYMDDVTVSYRPACPAVENIRRDSASTNMMTLSWSACPAPQSCQVEYGVSGFVQGQGTIHGLRHHCHPHGACYWHLLLRVRASHLHHGRHRPVDEG